MIAREIPVAGLVGRTADRDLEPRRLHQRKGAHHLAPHPIDRGSGKGAVVRGQPLAQHLGLAARTQRQPAGRLGRGDLADQGSAAANQLVQVAVDGVDFLPQRVQFGGIHGAARILRRDAMRKGNKAHACVGPPTLL